MWWVTVPLHRWWVGIGVAAVAAAAVLALVVAGRWPRRAGATTEPRQDVAFALERILAERADALVNTDDGPLARHYDLESVHGRWALEHERRRIRYVQAWADKRGVRLVSASVRVRVAGVRATAREAWLSVVQTARLGYVYRGDPEVQKHLFGIGTRHAIQLVRKGSGWVVRRDWYTDPLDEDTLIPEVTPADVSASGGMLASLRAWQLSGGARCSPPGMEDSLRDGMDGQDRVVAAARRYDREAAVRYARQFCGAAWGCGNDGRYNPRYRDYTDIGGDCTNFTSQVLHAGGLPMTSSWYYRPGSGGSRAWVQTEGLLHHLLASGRAELLARGPYGLVMTGGRSGRPPIDRLQPGDVIGYQEKGRVVHLAPVTGRDFRGYVVVNSHTADRNMVPWDVGWDQGTIFWLLHVRDGSG